MTTTQRAHLRLRIGMIGVTGRGGLWKHGRQPSGRSVVVADVNSTEHANLR